MRHAWVLVLLAAAAASGARSPKRPPAEKPRASRLDWRSDVDAALDDAAGTDRLVLAYFRADWCQPCLWMDRGPFGSRKMAVYIQRHFVPVRIDDTEATSPATRRYHVRVYPSVLVLDEAGEALHIILGPREAKELHGLLEQIRRLPGLIARQKEQPDDLEANFALGDAFARLHQLERAAPYLEKVVELDPANEAGRKSQAALMLAMVPIEGNRVAEVLRNLDLYLETFPEAPEVPVALHFKGTVLYGGGELRKAREVFQELCRRFPKHRMAYKAEKAIRAIDARLAGKPADDEPDDAGPQAGAGK